MLILAQLISIAGVFALTYLFFRAIGPRRDSVVYSAQERADWDKTTGSRLGGWFTVTSVVGTVTSLATAYLFFIGNFKVFGLWIFLCPLTIWIGTFATNYFTKKIRSQNVVKALIDSHEQRGGVVASLFWSDNRRDRITSRFVKWISFASIVGVIWLEFALFADISGKLIGLELWPRVAVMAFVTASISWFTLRYGLRGFVFADLLHAPLLVACAIVMLAGGLWLWQSKPPAQPVSWASIQPLLPPAQLWLFAGHVFVLNLFLMLVSEIHWLRLWLFRDREITLQNKSMIATAILWTILAAVGLLAFVVTGKVGDDASSEYVLRLSDSWILFAIVFWLGAGAALISTADSQIYAVLLVRSFDSNSGRLTNQTFASTRPVLASAIGAVLFSALYYGARVSGWHVEKIIFGIIPLSLNILPAISLLAFGRIIQPHWLVISLTGYLGLTCWGLMSPADQFAATLSAALVPVAVSLFAIVISKPRSGGMP
jgi:hypothetical protein